MIGFQYTEYKIGTYESERKSCRYDGNMEGFMETEKKFYFKGISVRIFPKTIPILIDSTSADLYIRRNAMWKLRYDIQV